MQTIETSHLPSADDISLDSLEYLFGPASAVSQSAVPWVEIAPDTKADTKQVAQLQAQVALLEKQLKDSSKQLQKVHIFIGYMQGLIQDKDEQLKQIPDLRFRAAEAVAWRLEATRAKERIEELEADLLRLSKSSNKWPDEILKLISFRTVSEDTAIAILSWLGVIGLTEVLLSII